MLASVLLLDDNKATNFIHNRFLNKSGLTKTVNCFDEGSEALHFLQNTHSFPELVFVDINMPEMSCWEFLREFRKLKRAEKIGTRIFLLTTTISPSDIDQLKEFPEVSELMLKPLNLESIAKIKELLSVS